MRPWQSLVADMGRKKRRHRIIWVLLAVLIAVITLGAAYKHFVVDSIMDGGMGMENPDVVQAREAGRMDAEETMSWPPAENTAESAE